MCSSDLVFLADVQKAGLDVFGLDAEFAGSRKYGLHLAVALLFGTNEALVGCGGDDMPHDHVWRCPGERCARDRDVAAVARGLGVCVSVGAGESKHAKKGGEDKECALEFHSGCITIQCPKTLQISFRVLSVSGRFVAV